MNVFHRKEPSMHVLKWFFLLTDISFILYFGATALGLIPPEWAYSDYRNPILIAWNWSFFPLDMLVSATGLTALYLYRKPSPAWKSAALISLGLTFCSGMMAVSYWAIRCEFDPAWWIPNLFLMIYPMFFIPKFWKGTFAIRV
ncbi:MULTISPECIES: DUF5360 family protein [Paenibacillus]|uniref:YvaD family protein n=1 Tax=Paenibacillus albilobatus TaxID=2716884 RepID=A0A920CC15_9BACL|nr:MULTISPECIES: DUF5360 family protein [Paenibacillus]GIO34196.1 hypothetical protein J2TS6_53370 [Paenibacillus albilobatus]